MKLLRTVAALILSLVGFSASTQHYFTEFGHNRIQYREFDWVYYSTTHFDVYYYEGGQDYAKQVINFMEEEFSRLTDVLGYAPYAKTKIFIYNSVHELQQSNIGKDGAVFTIGGQTDFVKLQIEIAHPGSATEFKKELIYKMSRILIEDMLFGGSLAEIFQSSYLLTLPKWFIDGAARYLAYGWSSEMDDFIRDYLERKQINKLIKIEGDEAGVVGQSIWNYIAMKYGRSNVSNILNLTRIIRNEENSISNTLGVSYRQFLADWQNYYIRHNEEISEYYKDPIAENELASKNNNEFKYNNVSVSPDGKKVAYSRNYLGKFKVFVHNLETGKTKKIFKFGSMVQGQKVDYSIPMLDWASDEEVSILYYKRGWLNLLTYNLNSGNKLVKNLNRFDQIESFSFNENGRLILISGDIDGQNDVYLVSMRRNAIRRITNDIYDDLDPAFIPGTAAFVFSSNRPNDSLSIENKPIEELTDNFNLFVYDLDTTTTSYYRLTNTYSRDYKPLPKNENEIYYLSDQRGISNLYKYSLLDSTFTQITNYEQSIKDYDLTFNNDGMAFLMLDRGVDRVYFKDDMNLDKSTFTPQTARQRFRQAKFVADIYNRKQIQDVIDKRQKKKTPRVKPDTLITDTIPEISEESDFVDPLNYQFSKEVEEKQSDYVDIDNYTFEDEGEDKDFSQRFRPQSFFSDYERFKVREKIYGPVPYQPQFSFQNLITSFAIDPLRGFGVVVETQINDLLENHKVTAGGLVITDLKSGDLFAEYEYLKYWMDLKIRVDRNTVFRDQDSENLLIQKYTLNKVTLGASLPLTNWFRFELNPFFAQTNFYNLQYENVVNRGNENFAEDSQNPYIGVVGKAVFDNTIEKGYNLLHGTRALAEVRLYQGVNNGNLNFGKFRFDFRHYQPIHREITWATRLFYGNSFGPNAQQFLLGGVPNWLFNRTQQHSNDPLAVDNTLDNSDILFVEYVTSLRGFDYNEMFGNSTLLLNTELRIPVFRYFARAPISSNFLRNFFLIGFADIGSAWTGAPPFTQENSATQVEYRDGQTPFFATITNYRNPWIASYGAGLRTLLLGYYARIDYSRPIRDMEVKKPKITVSIGLDF